MIMDEIAPKRRSRRRLFGFWARYRAKQDQETIEVLSDPSGRHDVQAAQAAQRSSQAKAAETAGKGGLYMGG
jgi:hypothetical protein